MEKLIKQTDFGNWGKADESLARYIPNLLPVTRQNQLADTNPRKAFASITYLDKKNLEFILELAANTYSNYSSMELVLPIQITKNTTKMAQLDADMINVNKFFAHWITDIDIRRYPDDTRILPTNNNVDVCQFDASQLKYLPKDSVKTIKKQLLYSNQPVYLAEGTDRRPNNDDDVNKRADENIKDIIAQFHDLIFKKNYFHISLGILVDLGLVTVSMKTDTKSLFTLERNMNKRFESTKELAAIPSEPDALIQFHNRPYIAYQEITLTQNFDIYFSGIIRSETAVRMGVLPAPYQQLFEVNKGIQSLTVRFKGAQRQFEWLEISFVYDKSYQHLTIYDSYDLELAAKMIQSIKF